MEISGGVTFALHTLLLAFTFTYGEGRDGACRRDQGGASHGHEDHGEVQPNRGEIYLPPLFAPPLYRDPTVRPMVHPC